MGLTMLNGRGEAVKTPRTLSIRPMCERVLVRKVESDRKGRIMMPESFEATLMEVVVLRLGPGRLRVDAKGSEDRIPINLRVGDRLVVSAAACLDIDPDDLDVKLVSEDNVIAILGDES